MIDNRSMQEALKSAGFYKGKIDGDFGPKSRAAREAMLKKVIGSTALRWPTSRKMLALQQWIMKEAGIDAGDVDGLMGPQTRYAFQKWQDYLRDVDPTTAAIAHQKSEFPRQKDLEKFYGKPGTNHAKIDLPFPMRIAWNKAQTITRFTINKNCAESAERAFGKVFDHYGYDRIRSLGLDLFGGCYNNRKMRGGSRLSTHAYACSLDINPEKNRLRWNSNRAAMASKDCAPFLNAFESEGWISLGRERNFDWMHLQAARL